MAELGLRWAEGKQPEQRTDPLGRRPGEMTGRHQHRGPWTGTAAVANLGIVRPPLVYLSSVLTGIVVQIAWPLPFLPSTLALPGGSSLVVVAITLFSCSVRELWAAGTPVPGSRPTTVIVRTGPYRFSRNPIYLAFSVLHLGIAIWVNSVWLVATLMVTVAVMIIVVIPREERYLEGRFGTDYLEYKASVRRWL
jgi:protein-S-isoprenylcysteine O-methyltransferase Ste14